MYVLLAAVIGFTPCEDDLPPLFILFLPGSLPSNIVLGLSPPAEPDLAEPLRLGYSIPLSFANLL